MQQNLEEWEGDQRMTGEPGRSILKAHYEGVVSTDKGQPTATSDNV